MAQDASTPPPARAPRKRRWRVALVVVLLAAVGAGWWWFTRPKAMRLVDVMTPSVPEMPAGQMEVRTYPEHFAVVSRQDVPVTVGSATHICYFRRAIALRRWNGEVMWQAHFPLPAFPRGRTPLNYALFGTMQSLSPNGRHCALAVVDGDSQQIIHWQDGRRVGTVRLPCRGILAHLYVFDSGVIYAWVPSAPIGSVFRIEGGRLAARGTVATPVAQGYPLGRFSPDGRAFITADNSGFVYHRVSVSGATLNLTPVYTAQEPVIKPNNHNLPYLVNADLLVATNGAVYTGRGKVSDSSGWQCFAYEHTPPSTALMQYRLPASMKSPLDAVAVRVFDPRTRTHWTPGDGTSRLVSAVTPDGRYALVGRQPARQFRAFVKTVATGKYLPSRVRTPLQRYLDRDEITLALYERPGRARATLHLSFGESSLPVIRHGGAQYRYQQLHLSPDGHTLRIIGHHEETGEKKIFTYAW